MARREFLPASIQTQSKHQDERQRVVRFTGVLSDSSSFDRRRLSFGERPPWAHRCVLPVS